MNYQELEGKTIEYDYTHQAWVIDGVYSACNHPEDMGCDCYGKLHAGERYTGCVHDRRTSYYTEDMVGMYSVCDDCGQRIPEEP